MLHDNQFFVRHGLSFGSLRRRFEQNQEDCTYTVLALLPTATENILKALPVENITQELRQLRTDRVAKSTAGSEIAPSEVPSALDDDGRSLASSSYIHASQVAGTSESQNFGSGATGKRSKVKLWNELKISCKERTCYHPSTMINKYTAITRAFTLIYTISLLTLFTRIQLNLLGRRNYLSSVVSLAVPPQEGSQISLENRDDDNLEQDYGNDFETNRKYLTFSWWLLHRGWQQVREKVEAAVTEAFKNISPKDDVSFQQLADLTLEVRKQVEGSTEEERKTHKWLDCLLPPTSEQSTLLRESVSTGAASSEGLDQAQDFGIVTPSLRRLLDETSDLIESPTFTHVLTLLLDAAFSHLIDGKIGVQAYNLPAQSPSLADQFTFNPRVQDVTDEDPADDPKQKTSKLATPMAIFTRQAHAIGSGGSISNMINEPTEDSTGFGTAQAAESNEYLAAIEAVQDLNAFAAVVYSSNFEFEGADTVKAEPQEDVGTGSFALVEKPIVAVAATSPEKVDGESKQPVSQAATGIKGVERDLESAWGKALAKEDGQA